MKISPNIKEIEKWLIIKNPLNLFKNNFSIKNIDPKKWSGHFNYLIETPKRKFVLRFKGPEWGKIDGSINEFKTLKKIEKYEVGPKVYYLTKNFFGEPMFFEEYLEGKLLNNFSENEQKKYFSDIAKFIYKINSIPFRKNDFLFQKPITNYVKNKKTWRTRIKFILDYKKTKICGQKLLTLLPDIELILDKFENRLQRVLKQTGNSFIFESAHLGHCIKTANGFRFFNWEKVSYGDPSYTLAVFLTSIYKRPDFQKVKKIMIKSYLAQRNIPEFSKLIDQRITERRISNIIWSIYMNAKKKELLAPNWNKKINGIKKIIKKFKPL